MSESDLQCKNYACCTNEFDELLCVSFTVTFTVDIIDCEITSVECLGPCPSSIENGCDNDCCESE